MSTYSQDQEVPKHVEAGKLLANRLHEARAKKGRVICPVCRIVFDAAHLIKCPECRTLIGETFKEWSPKNGSAPQKVGATKNLPFQRESPKHKNTGKRRKTARRKTSRPQKVVEKLQLELDFFTQGYMEYRG